MGNDSDERAKILAELCYQMEDAVTGANYIKRNIRDLLIYYGEDKELVDSDLSWSGPEDHSEEINEENIADSLYWLKDDIDETVSLLRKVKKLRLPKEES